MAFLSKTPSLSSSVDRTLAAADMRRWLDLNDMKRMVFARTRVRSVGVLKNVGVMSD